MWRPPCLFLCLLLVVGCTAVSDVIEKDLTTEDEHLNEIFNMLDIVDDSTLGEVDDVIADDLEEDLDEDQDEEVMIVDPPPLTEEELPAVDLGEEDQDEEEDDIDEEVTDEQAGSRGRGTIRDKKFYKKKAKKWARKHLGGAARQGRGRGRGRWWKKAWNKLNNVTAASETGGAQHGTETVGEMIHKEVDRMTRRRGKGRRAHFQAQMELEPETEIVDDDVEVADKAAEAEERRRGGGRHRKPHHRRGGRGKGPHHKGHPGRPHRRGRHHRRTQWAPLEKRVAMICWKLQKPQHQRFLQSVHQRLEKGIGNTDRKTYRIQFVDKMQSCCQNNATREQCFVSLTHQRYDNFCDNEMPLKPWAPAGRRHRNVAIMLSSTCCEHAGEMRYSCFNGSRRAAHMEPNVDQVEVEEDIGEIEEEILEDVEEDEDEEDVDDVITESTPPAAPQVGRRGGRRKHQRRRGGVPQAVKTNCCDAGKKATGDIDQHKLRASCMHAGRKYALYRKEFRAACAFAFGRCCIRTVKGTGEEDTEITDVYEFEDLEDEEDVKEVVNRRDRRPVKKVVEHPPRPISTHHDHKEKKHHERREHRQPEDQLQIFY